MARAAALREAVASGEAPVVVWGNWRQRLRAEDEPAVREALAARYRPCAAVGDVTVYCAAAR